MKFTWLRDDRPGARSASGLSPQISRAFFAAAEFALLCGISTLFSNLTAAIGPSGSVGNTYAVARSLLSPGTSEASHSQRQDRIHRHYLNFWKTRGSIAAAPNMPPASAPAIPGLITSWPAKNRPGTGVRALSASDNIRRGVVSRP